MNRTNKILTSLLLICSISYGQMKQYHYKRELQGISGQWHNLILPDDLFGKVSQSLSDIRIFGITASNDTVEAPYLLRLATEKISDKEVAFTMLNASHNEKGYFFTLEIPSSDAINQIKLNFGQKNFDWKIKLEGSQNQNEWFTIVEDYRILSIKNETTDFKFTTLSFPSSNYRFFKLCISSKKKPELISASIAQHEIAEGTFRNYTIKKLKASEKKDAKQTEIEIELQQPVSVSRIRINVKDAFDYYRPITIQYLSDSIKTEQGWIFNYNTLTSGTLNSLEKNEFTFSSTIVQKIKIIIHNQDNQPLTIDTVQAKGYVHELAARFTEQATYYLTYGSNTASQPDYDINRFTENIPTSISALEIGKEQTIDHEKIQAADPLFKNKTWLWVIMGVVILLLGWFSMRMMRKG